MTSFVTAVASSVAIFFAPSVEWIYLVGVFSGFQSLALPGVSALYMNVADPALRGQVQGALNSVLTASKALGSILFGVLFFFFLQPRFGMQEALLGAPWVIAMVLGSLCLVMLFQMPASAFQRSDADVGRPALEEPDGATTDPQCGSCTVETAP
mmetsp:Transcript_12943/g.35774  ORF Transcript_12943/g.35774 Transcript_12943/m.35774 type:complete len:154 (-) Transcript_12943:51-512(-)